MKRIKKTIVITLSLLIVLITAVPAFATGLESNEDGNEGGVHVLSTINTISGETTDGSSTVETVITPVITESGSGSDKVRTATITPLDVSSGVTIDNRGKTTFIKQSDLDAYTAANDIDKVEIVTGMGATAYVNAKTAPQMIITDDQGNALFEAVAKGGQFRYDKKMEGSSTIGRYSTTKDKSTAIDFVDLRLQYEFKLPEDVNVSANSNEWHWTLTYGSYLNTVNGVYYLPVSNEKNTYTSNVVVTNIPISDNNTRDFETMLSITYVKDGISYTITQSSTTPLARTIKDITDYYKLNSVYNTLDDKTKVFVNAVYDQLEKGSYTPVA